MKVLFLFAKSFSFTGGIEKFNQCLLKALKELHHSAAINAFAISLYESNTMDKYFLKEHFKGWRGNKIFFLVHALFSSLNKDVIIISHINFAMIPYLAKVMMPAKKLIIVVHGIEAWKPLTGIKKRLLNKADIILSVSEFTKQQLLSYNSYIDSNKIQIFPNTIDPYFTIPKILKKPDYLMQRYRLSSNTQLLVSVTRISSVEKYKGYDKVIESLTLLKESFPAIKYLLCGKYDQQERERIYQLVEANQMNDSVILTGYISELELADHYLLADIFILPSKGEGFGIAFLEAQACGRKVIAGNQDGSKEALLKTPSNRLVNPNNPVEIKNAIVSLLEEEYQPVAIQKAVVEKYGFNQFKNRLSDYLNTLN